MYLSTYLYVYVCLLHGLIRAYSEAIYILNTLCQHLSCNYVQDNYYYYYELIILIS